MNEQEALMILNAVNGLVNMRIRSLLDRYGSALAVLSLSEADLKNDGIVPDKILQNLIQFPRDNFLKTEFDQMAKRKAQVITFGDAAYPALLKEIPDAPLVLYCKGGDLSLEHGLSMAMVGTRKASPYGLSAASKLSKRLAELGFTVVSGLARGIDTAAHKGALMAGGRSIAVLGCGLSHVYPLENEDLLEEIAEGGAVVSEFSMQTPPFAHNFPRRNRIVSGLALGVIVIEAAQRSGALITADCALEQGRDVFAVPGRIDSLSSEGVHHLIKQGAKLVTCIEDILEDLEPKCSALLKTKGQGSSLSPVPRAPLNQPRMPGDSSTGDKLNGLSDDERDVFSHITDRPVHIDALTHSCRPSVAVMSILLRLELKKLVRQMPGKLFVR